MGTGLHPFRFSVFRRIAVSRQPSIKQGRSRESEFPPTKEKERPTLKLYTPIRSFFGFPNGFVGFSESLLRRTHGVFLLLLITVRGAPKLKLVVNAVVGDSRFSQT